MEVVFCLLKASAVLASPKDFRYTLEKSIWVERGKPIEKRKAEEHRLGDDVSAKIMILIVAGNPCHEKGFRAAEGVPMSLWALPVIVPKGPL